MGFSQDQIDYAQEPLIDLLKDPLPIGDDLREKVMQFYQDRKMTDADSCCREIYQLGLNSGDNYVQAVALYLLGMVYFGLGSRPADRDKALEFYEQSAHVFRSCSDCNIEHCEGIVWFSIGRLYERQCDEKDKWEDSIEAYRRAALLFHKGVDPLDRKATDSERRVARKWKDHLAIKDHVSVLATTPRQSAKVSRSSAPSAQKDSPISNPPGNTLRSPSANPSPIGCFAIGAWISFIVTVFLLSPIVLYMFATNFLQWGYLFLLGFVIALAGTLVPFVVYFLADQLVYYVPPNSAAIITYRGRIWEIEGPGRHWAIPFIENTNAIILLRHKGVTIHLSEYADENDGFRFGVFASADCLVVDVVKSWAFLNPLKPPRLLGIAKPITSNQTTPYIVEKAQRLIKEVMLESAKDPVKREFFEQKRIPGEQLLALLTEKAEPYGLQFENLHVKPQIRDGFPKPNNKTLVLLALESTVITHGLPYPQNLDTAREMQSIARTHGVDPRTIAVLKGEIKIGLSNAEMEYLAKSAGVGDIKKLGRRDIPIAIARKQDGSTTVSATMALAHRAGIQVFATGGIGGVHRTTDGQQPNDISEDLPELGRTPVVVVCAGAKAILDLPATVEWLETHGVPVLGYQTAEFPAFYSRSSGQRVQTRIDSPDDAAQIIREHWRFGNQSGVLVCVPIPVIDEIPRDEIEPFIVQALLEAKRRQITGSAITPFLLAQLKGLTQDRTVRANVALLKNNVAVAAEIAKALHIATHASQV